MEVEVWTFGLPSFAGKSAPKLQGTAPTSGPRRREVGPLNATDQTHCPSQCVSLWDVPVPRALFCLNGSTGSQLGPKLVGSSLQTTPVS